MYYVNIDLTRSIPPATTPSITSPSTPVQLAGPGQEQPAATNPRTGRPKGARPREHIIAAVKAYMSGELMDDIAARFGVTQPTVSYWIAKHGQRYGGAEFVRRKQGRRADASPSVRDMAILFKAINGVPLASIGREYGLTRARVSHIVKIWGQRGFVVRSPKSPGEVSGDLPAPQTQNN